MIRAALDIAEARRAPCSPVEFARALDKLFAFAANFGIKADVASTTRIYRDTLNLPADLLNLAVERTLRQWVWGNRLPMPGDLLKFVDDELRERTADYFTLRTAMGKADVSAINSTLAAKADRLMGTFQAAGSKANNTNKLGVNMTSGPAPPKKPDPPPMSPWQQAMNRGDLAEAKRILAEGNTP